MSNTNMLEKIKSLGIVPVVKIDDADKAVPLAEALCRGGLPCAEITFRTDAAEEAIRRISDALPDMLVGAGTVLTPEQADKAKAAGAKFIMSPGFNPRVVKHCQNIGAPMFPGCSTPTDIEQALEFGLSCVKFFPAEQAGGLAMIKALAAPYNILFLPTGGINAKNLNDYLAFDRIVACGGSWMVEAALINAGDFAKIEELTREAVKLVKK
jgi:2-dehydro-3-deoxyphosphogluconate aldolase/(4S)-4-hydroxy-2-oxoglutarate aldolase